MHDLCVPSIYSTHHFVSNVYSILEQEGTRDIRLFGIGDCVFAQVIFTVICTSILPNMLTGIRSVTKYRCNLFQLKTKNSNGRT